MKLLLTLILGIVIGAGSAWYLTSHQRDSRSGTTDDIRQELARTGRVIREKAGEAGHALADATADARLTATIKAKLISHKDLSGFSISVNTTAGVVTLSGNVSSTDQIKTAMAVALETDGVRQVISTLQIKSN